MFDSTFILATHNYFETMTSDTSWSRRGAFLLKSGVLTDVCVRVGDTNFPCHKIVLASASEFFEKLFANEGSATEVVELTETNPKLFKTFIDYIYSWNDKPLRNLTHNELALLLQSSHMWMAFEVEKTCVKFLLDRCSTLQPKELIQLYGFSCLLDKKSIMDRVIEIMQKKYPMDHKEIYNMDIDSFTKYFQCTKQFDESKRFSMAEKWVLKNVSPIRGSFYSINVDSKPKNFKPVSLSEKVDRIFQCINFEKMSLNQFYNGPGKSKLLADSRKFEIIYKIANRCACCRFH